MTFSANISNHGASDMQPVAPSPGQPGDRTVDSLLIELENTVTPAGR